jgi:hypothetical protein
LVTLGGPVQDLVRSIESHGLEKESRIYLFYVLTIRLRLKLFNQESCLSFFCFAEDSVLSEEVEDRGNLSQLCINFT